MTNSKSSSSGTRLLANSSRRPQPTNKTSRRSPTPRQRERRAKLKLALQRDYLRLKRENLIDEATVLFLQSQIAELKLDLFLVLHGWYDAMVRGVPPNDES
jgi:hypothetical protein